MRVPILATLALLMCFALPACKRMRYKEHIWPIEKLLFTVDSSRNAITLLDRHALHLIDSVYDGKRDSVMALMKDTLDKPDAIVLGNFHQAMTWTLDRVWREIDGVENELTTTRKQLIDLRHDVDHGLLSPEQEKADLATERQFVEFAKHRAGVLCASAARVTDEWRLHHARVDSLLHAAPKPALP